MFNLKQKIIYQIMIDRFVGNIIPRENGNLFLGGNIKGVISKLDYIKSMGFNTIMLNPFCKTSEYHGYHIEDYYEVDHHFGTSEDVQDLVKEAHRRDIQLMFDFIPNHCSHRHPFFIDALNNPESIYRNWFYFGKNNNYKTFLNLKELPKFNLNNPEASDYLIKACQHWVLAGFDYVRIDHAIGVPFPFLSKLVRKVKKVKPTVEFFGEVWNQGVPRNLYNTLSLKRPFYSYLFGLNQERIQKDYINILDGIFDFEFSNILIRTVQKGEKCMDNRKLQETVDKHFSNYPCNFELILMLDNHDMNRFLYYCRGDEEKLIDALQFIKKQDKSFSVYYGTECLMKNDRDIFDKTSYADLRVREPFQLSKPEIVGKITDIIRACKHSE